MNDGEISAWHFANRKPVRLRWKGGVITTLDKPTTPPPADLWIAPPLFDIQVNGYGGIDFQQDDFTTDDLLGAVEQMRQSGCARFLMTFITDEWEALKDRLRFACDLRAENPVLKTAIAGWHIEGPFLSKVPGFHGAHNPALMLEPTEKHIRELRDITGDDPLLLTISPEVPGAIEAIALAVSLGIKISLGHTDASAEIIGRAIDAGATGFTHLGNGCPRELDRHDNILWRVLDRPELTVSVIPDKIHVSPALFRLFHRVIDRNRIVYTTDAMSAAGAPPGRYKLAGMEVEVGADQIVRQPGKTNFAGSALKPMDGIFRAAQMLGVPWQDVWTRFSEIPARFMGLPNNLSVGLPANFCLLKMAGENEVAELKVIAPE